MAGELVHDLANDMQVLQGWASLARGEVEQGHLPAMELERVLLISESLGRTLQDVLATVAGQSVSPEVKFAPDRLTEATLAERFRDLAPAEIRFKSTLPAGVLVTGRASFWVRALVNLLRNGSRHARSEVLVTLRLDEGDGREQVVLRVEDDGAGVMPQLRALVFEPLWRGKRGGVGLGLSSAAWSIDQLGGEIRYMDDSALGGAAFEVRVPRAVPVVAKSVGIQEAPTLHGKRMLLIDDDPAIRLAVSRLLRRNGVDVREIDPVARPDEPLLADILSGLADVILMDLHLRDRGGLALWRRLRNEVPHVARRVVFISGSSSGDPAWEDATRTGQPVLGKPFDLRQLAVAMAAFEEDR